MGDFVGRRLRNASKKDHGRLHLRDAHKIDEQLSIISIISEFLTIEPGDILFAGAPAGSAGEPGGCWLKAGDRLRAEIQHVGVLDVTMRSE